MKQTKPKVIQTHRVYFTEPGKAEKSFTCSREMLDWHLKEVKKMNTKVRFERIGYAGTVC